VPSFEHTVVVTDDGADVLTVTASGDSAVGLPAATLAV
jgi:hypothetical protein